MKNQIALSVITPYNGSVSFYYFLCSLEAQSLDPTIFELIIVQDKGCDAARDLNALKIKFVTKVIPYPTDATQEVKHTAGILRNEGVMHARGDIIVFVDSDCLLERNCLLSHFKFHNENKSSVLCGSTTELLLIYQKKENIEKIIRSEITPPKWLLPDFRHSETIRDAQWLELYTSNVSLDKTLFHQAGGFDVMGYRCHDMDLSYRIFILGGINYKYDPFCQTIHLEHERSIFYRRQQIQGWLRMKEKHPELTNLTENKVRTFENAFHRVQKGCEQLFENIYEYFQRDIVKVGYNLLVEDTNKTALLTDILNRIPHKTLENSSCFRYILRLHRDCWDYQIISLKHSIRHPFFSVLITFKSDIIKLIRSVESVLIQTFQDFEIIVVNDYSEEEDYTPLQPLLKSKRLKIINNQKNYGQSKSLNIGLLNSEGSFIVQLDSDDWLSDTALDEIHNFLSAHNVDAIYGSPFITDGNGIKTEKGYYVDSPIDCLTYRGVQAPRIYSRSFLLKIGGWSTNDAHQGRYYEDRLMLMKVAESGRLAFFDKPLYYATINHKSLTRRNPLATATAKFSIIMHEANRQKKDVEYELRKHFLHVNFRERSTYECCERWSVIIPFSRNLFHLQIVLRSWKEALDNVKDKHCIELIIINDAIDETLSTLREVNIPLRIYSTGGNKGPAFCRNLGVAKSKNDLIFFCDEDHIVPPTVFAIHEQLHKTEKNAVVVGNVFGRRVLIDIDCMFKQYWRQTILENMWLDEKFEDLCEAFTANRSFTLWNPKENIYQECFKYSYTDQWQKEWATIYLKNSFDLSLFPHRWLKCSTGNLSIKKQNFVEIGKFSEQLNSMEDWEFGLRAVGLDYSFLMAPSAEPFHIIHAPHKSRTADDNNSIAYIVSKYSQQIDSVLHSNDLNSYKNTFAISDRINDEKEALTTPPILAITFDDGPHEFGTALILDVLSVHDIKATFFVLGERSLYNKQLLKKINREGHEIGIHNWDHRPYSQFTIDELLNYLNKSKNVVEQITSRHVDIIRPPYGIIPKDYISILNDNYYRLFGWTISGKDWSSGVNSSQIMTNIASSNVKNQVLLFHDGTGEPLSLATCLSWLHRVCSKSGLKLVTASDFLNKNSLNNLLSCLRPK